MRRSIGYYELNGTRHVVFDEKRVPQGAMLQRNADIPPPPPPSRDERIEREIQKQLPGILRMIRNHEDFAGELQRQIQDVTKEVK
jgi:hypothetical protein